MAQHLDPHTRRFVEELLAAHNVLTLATVQEDGWPQATTVGYVNDGLTIYVGAAKDSQKVRNRHCQLVPGRNDSLQLWPTAD